METFWNDGPTDATQGVDVLGIRGLDQALEKRWVAAFTTVSIRARYLSLLPWFLAGYYRRISKQQGTFSFDAYGAALARLEFLTAAATALHASDSGDTYGTLGKDVYSSELRALLDTNQSVPLPTRARWTISGTYFNPAAGFGFLVANPDGASVPSAVLPRGEAVARARDARWPFKEFERLFFDDNRVNRSALEELGEALAINRITSNSEETKVLRDAILAAPEETGPETTAIFARFRATVSWILSAACSGPVHEENLIGGTLANVLTDPGNSQEVQRAWAEYEIHRLAHYGYELVLAAVSAELRHRPSTLSQVISEWSSETRVPAELADRTGLKTVPWRKPLQRAISEFDAVSIAANRLSPRLANDLSPGPRAVYGLTLVLASNALREKCLLPLDRGTTGDQIHRETLGSVRDTIRATEESTFAAFALSFMTNEIVGRHLGNTFRKMSAGMKSSLRFYADGNVLYGTKQRQWASRSGARLGNVMQVLCDLGLLRWTESGGYRTTVDGKKTLDCLRTANAK